MAFHRRHARTLSSCTLCTGGNNVQLAWRWSTSFSKSFSYEGFERTHKKNNEYWAANKITSSIRTFQTAAIHCMPASKWKAEEYVREHADHSRSPPRGMCLAKRTRENIFWIKKQHAGVNKNVSWNCSSVFSFLVYCFLYKMHYQLAKQSELLDQCSLRQDKTLRPAHVCCPAFLGTAPTYRVFRVHSL